jgi:hypothetical protein
LNTNAPHFLLAAVSRIYPELPILIGADHWLTVQAQIDTLINGLETQPNNYLAMTQLFGLLSTYEPVRQCLSRDMTIQAVISDNISEQMRQIAQELKLSPESVEGLTAAALARLQWDVDTASIPAVGEEASTRGVTLSDGGIGGAKSVKFKNMKLDLGDAAKLSAGFVTTGFDIIDKPHPLVVAAGVLLTVCALYDAMKTNISEQDASVFWGMIQATGSMKGAGLKLPTILEKTNVERAHYHLDALSETQIRYSLEKLERLKSIEKVGDTYRIIERYTIKD